MAAFRQWLNEFWASATKALEENVQTCLFLERIETSSKLFFCLKKVEHLQMHFFVVSLKGMPILHSWIHLIQWRVGQRGYSVKSDDVL